MSERRCKTCKWWSTNQQHVVPKLPDNTCRLITTYDGKPGHESARAEAVGYYGEEAILYAQPDFGCVQWEPAGAGEGAES